MLKINIKTIKQRDLIDDIAINYKDKNVSLGEYTTLLKFTIDRLKEYPIELDKFIKMFMEEK